MAVVRFGDLTLDAEQALLVGPDEPIAVEPQVFAVLAHLATRPGMLVTKEELLDEIWGSCFVTESSLTSRIRAARAAVGDDGRASWSSRPSTTAGASRRAPGGRARRGPATFGALVAASLAGSVGTPHLAPAVLGLAVTTAVTVLLGPT